MTVIENQTQQKKLFVGQIFSKEINYNQKRVENFAFSSGDTNPLHLDPAYASTTVFKRPIMHGMIGAGAISSIIGTQIEGSIYLSQNLSFKKPMYVDTIYEVIVTVLEINTEKHIAKLSTDIIDKNTKEICVKGDAVVLNKGSV